MSTATERAIDDGFIRAKVQGFERFLEKNGVVTSRGEFHGGEYAPKFKFWRE